MSFSELGRVIDLLVKDRGIKRDVIVGAIEQAFVVAARKKFGIQGEYEARYNDSNGDVEIYQYKNVIEEVRDPILEISYVEARGLNPDCELGDQLGLKIENPGFTRVDVQTAKQIIFQKVRDAEREILYKEFKHREGEVITGIARRYERGNVIVDLGKADAVLSRREIIPGENFRPGDRIQAYLSEVVMTNRGPEIRLSRTSPIFLVKLFEMEVPEINDGIIEIKSAAREPGYRAKIAVISRDKDIDPVGACVGMKGSRVQNVVNELQGEKIDIVKWSEDVEVFGRSTLAPAEIASIVLGENKTMDVIVEDDQLSLAIGKRGQNVRLAAMLTGWKVNIISKSKLSEKVSKAAEAFSKLEFINDAMAQVLVHEGVMSLKDLCALSAEEIKRITGLDIAVAAKILNSAQEAFKIQDPNVAREDDIDIISASATPAINSSFIKQDNGDSREDEDRFSEAERRLREELAAFKIK
jgi:N utilization substance protein A